MTKDNKQRYFTSSGKFDVYTDGACIGNPGPGGWGAVMIHGNAHIEFAGGEPKTTNNRMEITAAIRGIDETPPGSDVTVWSDSEYVIKTMTRGWKRKVNNDLWDQLDDAVANRNVSWEWVRGHSGDPMNELADTLARGEARAIRSSGGRMKANNRSDAKRSDGKAKNGGAAKRSDASPSLSHVDSSGKARMVDVGAKPDTERVAEAKGSVTMSPETLRLIKEGGFEKGDVLGTARIAGVMAAKQTSNLIPLCHPLPLTQVNVEIAPLPDGTGLEVASTARTRAKTGVEMEALTAVSIAALTIYDMCKSADRAMVIGDIRLTHKSGGKSGDYHAS